MKLDEIKHLINELEIGILDLENGAHLVTSKEFTKYQNEARGLKKIFGIGKPKVYVPTWKSQGISKSINALIKTGKSDQKQLAAELNLFTLNSAIYIIRLQGGKEIVAKAESLRVIAESFRKV
mgnify:CR=1 FL=1